MTDRLVYITQGAHGCASAQGIGRYGTMSLSSYDRLDEFLERHGDEIVDGAPVVDLVPLAEAPNIVTLVWESPLCDPTLVDDDVDRWDGDGDVLSLAPVIAGNYFGAAGVKAAITTTVDEPGPFDKVSPRRHAAYWASHGARVGHWNATDRTVNWEE